MEHSVVGVYKTLSEAETAVRSLRDGGFPVQKVSIISKDMEDDQRVHGYITASGVSHRSETVGTWVGGIFGALVGAAFVWVPGFGLLVIAGSLASVLLGGVEGAMAGAAAAGALGWLVGFGISEEQIHKYETALKAGKFLVMAYGPEDTVKKAHKILMASQAEQLDHHAQATT